MRFPEGRTCFETYIIQLLQQNGLNFRDFAGNSKIILTKVEKDSILYLLTKLIKLSLKVYFLRQF